MNTRKSSDRFVLHAACGVWIVGALLAVWFLTTAAFAAAPTIASVRRYVVTDHGAVGDGTTVNTKVLQAAIDRCAADGGGLIVVPKGTFLSGALFFKQGVDLLVEKDAILKSTIAMADFPPIYTRWEGIERSWTAAFLNFVGLNNVTVAGEGTIDGSGDAFAGPGQRARGASGAGQSPDARASRADPGAVGTPRGGPGAAPATATPVAALLPKPAEAYGATLPTTATINFAPDPANLPAINAAGLPLPGRGISPPRALVFQNCTGVRVSGLTLKNQARWGCVFIYCENVMAQNLIARAEHYIPSSDSMDIDSCRQVLVSGCDFDCNDDCISIKSGNDEDGRRVNRPCENIVIEKSRFRYGHGGVAMGSEVSGGIRNVEVRQCVMDADNWAPIRFKSQPSRGGVVENITYRDIELRDTRQMVEFNLEWRMVPPIAPPAPVLTTVRNVRIINVAGTTRTVGVIHGLLGSPIQGVTFENCRISAQRGLRIDNARAVDLTGLKLDVKEGEPVTKTNVE